jgi:antitoxin component of MazEF toxin-antitoxin module
MKPTELKVTRIGNSRGISLPADSLRRYEIEDTLIMEERSDGILLRGDAWRMMAHRRDRASKGES